MADSRWRLLLPPSVRTFPADLTAIVVLVVLTVGAVFLPVVRQTPVRIILGLPFALFVPGYALIAALFPGGGELIAGDEDPEGAGRFEETSSTVDTAGISGLERIAFSFGTSIAVVPLIGLVLNFTPWGIRLIPIMVALGGVTLVLVGIAARRRQALPEEDRFSVPYRGWFASMWSDLRHPETRTDGALNVLLVISLVLAVGSVSYAVGVPKSGEEFTEFYLLTEGEDGKLVADNYPTNFTSGESQFLYVGISNHEQQSVEYSVVVELQRVQIQNNSTVVQSQTELRRFRKQLAANETWRLNHTVTPQMTGDRLRLTYLLYKGDVPADPTVENAYRETHLWINVSQSEPSELRSHRLPKNQ